MTLLRQLSERPALTPAVVAVLIGALGLLFILFYLIYVTRQKLPRHHKRITLSFNILFNECYRGATYQ